MNGVKSTADGSKQTADGWDWVVKITATTGMFLIIVLTIAAILVFGMGVVAVGPRWRWLIIAGIMAAFVAILGAGITKGRPDGVFIDSRRKISLSRFQIVLWTLLVLSAYLTIALPRALPDGLHNLTDAMVSECIEEHGGQELAAIEAQIATAEENVVLAEENQAAANEGLEDAQVDYGAEVEAGDEDEAALAQGRIDVAEQRVATAEQNLARADEELTQAEEKLAVSEEAAAECQAQPLKITFPPELIAALGISTASFAGSNLVKSAKQSRVFKNRTRIERLRRRIEETERDIKQARTKVNEVSENYADLADAALVLSDAEKRRDVLQDEIAQAEDKVANAASDEARKAAEDALQALRDELAQVERTIRLNAPLGGQLEPEKNKLEQAKGQLNQLNQERERLEENLADAQVEKSLLHQNDDVSKASWMDIFRAEEEGNSTIIDMGKVQMFFFTIVVVFTYAALVWSLLGDEDVLKHPLGLAFPAFSASLNTLLGISHAGYLTSKWVGSTPKEEADVEDREAE